MEKQELRDLIQKQSLIKDLDIQLSSGQKVIIILI